MKFEFAILLITFGILSCGTDSNKNFEMAEDSLASRHQSESNISSISDLITLINELPKPVTINCFVSSLPNQIGLNGMLSKISVQPARSRIQW